MQLWVERFVLAICAAAVFGLSILNPLRLDWQQRVSLAIAIAAASFFIAHTYRRPPQPVVAPSEDPRVAILQDQIKVLQDQQEQISKGQEQAQKEREHKRQIREQLARFLQEGLDLLQRCSGDPPGNTQRLSADANAWMARVIVYLKGNLDDSYVTQFKSTTVTLFNPNGVPEDRIPLTEPVPAGFFDADFIFCLRVKRISFS